MNIKSGHCFFLLSSTTISIFFAPQQVPCSDKGEFNVPADQGCRTSFIIPGKATITVQARDEALSNSCAGPLRFLKDLMAACRFILFPFLRTFNSSNRRSHEKIFKKGGYENV